MTNAIRLTALTILVLSLASPASAVVPTYTFVRIWDYNGATFTGTSFPDTTEIVLAENGDIAVSVGGWGNDSLFTAKRGVKDDIAFSGTGVGQIAEFKPREFNDDGTILSWVRFDFDDPRFSGIQLSTDLIPQALIASWPSTAPGELESDPVMNASGIVLYVEDDGANRNLKRWENGVTTTLATCESLEHPQINDSGTIAFECWLTFSDSVIHRGTAAPFPVFVNASSFIPTNPGSNQPFGITPAGDVGFQHFGGSPTGTFVKGAGAPVSAGDLQCDVRAFTAQGLFLCDQFTSIRVRSIAANPISTHTLISNGSALAGSTVYVLGFGEPDLNDRGQIAFAARLDDGTAGIFLATPTSCDSDLDGWCDAQENCPAAANFDQRDSDKDGVGDRCDNCAYHANTDQLDSNGDGRGNVCGACGLGPNAPICGTHSVGAGTSTLDVENIPFAAFPSRPMLYAQAYSNTPGLTVTASIDADECTGGSPHPFSFSGFNDVNDGKGFLAARVFDEFVEQADRVGALCPVHFTSSGVAGSYSYRIEAATEIPVGGRKFNQSTGTTVNTVAPTPDAIPFLEESSNYRFLYAGTGGTNFGTCQFNPNPPVEDDPPITYSAAPGPGWDCCTFQFDGVDGVPSSPGQLVFNLNGTAPVPDPDHDGFLSPCDSCDFKANGDQADGGGVNTTNADGIGDACQCGLLDAGGVIDAADVLALRRHLAQHTLLPPAKLPFCSVIGGPTECTIRTLTVLRRRVAGLTPLLQQTCTAALP